MNENKPRPKRKIYQWALMAVGPLMLLLLWLMVDFDKLWIQLKQVDITLFGVAILLLCSTLFVRTFRWKLLLESVEKQPPYFSLLMIYSYASFAGVVTPGRIGELVKAFHLKSFDISIGRAMANVLTDRLLDVLVLLMVSLVSFLLVVTAEEDRNLVVPLIVLGVLGGFSALWWFVRSAYFETLIGFIAGSEIKFVQTLFKKFSKIGNDFRSEIQKQEVGTLIQAFLLTLVAWGVVYCANWMISKSLGLNLSYFQIVAISSVSSLAAQLPVSVLGVGTRDATMILILAKYGVSKESALALSTLFLASMLVVAAICALSMFSAPMRLAKKYTDAISD